MQVFKFGGASIKNASSVENMSKIIKANAGSPLVVVVSAMGKTTNLLEKIFFKKIRGEESKYDIELLESYHLDIVRELFSGSLEQVSDKIQDLIFLLIKELDTISGNIDKGRLYASVVAYGELISSTIIAEFLNKKNMAIEWIDARNLIRTDDTFREGKVDWTTTEKSILTRIGNRLNKTNFITQGFIASTPKGLTTTLGREGSDFTAAIFGACLKAESVTIWKDVPGILNADPKRFNTTELYGNLSYQEAAEMTYYGASVIHPRTIKPLANKNIPLLVKSFEKPELPGTVIDQGKVHRLPPTFIIKDEQCLVSFAMKDLSFINEKNLSIIFHILDKLNIKINMMQNSAVSLTVCFDNQNEKVDGLIRTLGNDFRVLYNQGLQLITIKNYTPDSIEVVSAGKDILVEQRTRNTFQIVVK